METPDTFLDTSVILQREFFQNKDQKNKIEKFLKKRNMVTSTYVNMELNRTYLKDAYTLDTMLQENDNLGIIEYRIKNIKYKRVKNRLELLFEKITQDDSTLQESKIKLKRIIKWYHTILLKGVTVISSKTECEQLLPQNKFECRGSFSMCRADKIIESNKPFLEVIRVKMLKNVQNDPKMLRICGTIYEVSKNPEKVKENPKNCFDMGDIFIAMDVPDGFTLVSEDKDFFTICEILNIPFKHITL